MRDIHVIYTRHRKNGEIVSFALSEIIQAINPQVIFEELSEENFRKGYEEGLLPTVEIRAIKHFLLSQNVLHIPVDTSPLPDSYYTLTQYLEEKIFGSLQVDECVQLRILVDSNMREMGEKGFSYLNSRKNYGFFQEYNRWKENILKALDADRLFAIHNMENEGIKGKSCLIRYADDFVLCFTDKRDAYRVLEVLGKRLEKYGLTLHPDKTRLIELEEGQDKVQDKAFDFLGFTHYMSRSLKGRSILKRKTSKKKFRMALKKMNDWLRTNRHMDIKELIYKVNLKLKGYYGYYGIMFNSRRIQGYFELVKRMLFKWLNRRGVVNGIGRNIPS